MRVVQFCSKHIPTVSLVKLFLPSVSISTHGKMNIQSVNKECSPVPMVSQFTIGK